MTERGNRDQDDGSSTEGLLLAPVEAAQLSLFAPVKASQQVVERHPRRPRRPEEAAALA
eukprot:CAMPEP_0177396442 /NCGR_PEP_ID=MMETSP0368-20130122/56726_1 /TAXON_ID=447022 ORGANISM="Scrippsiella hangoei-like, Strain SHHI-4" /NCGR_SAMPLE_ID=MMETSP0368 /ASSEMBLY_ACC=CAM_ASM_000363 /LENGTH=58 /DNA_ID=CAMNT_0018863171 /DNA_START=37 /DNA_END=211 /DNA_ORIENTATION=+